MKSVAVLALAAGASAQVSLYTNIAKSINAQISALDSAIKAYTGGDGSAVIASASALLSGVESGSAAAAKGQPISDLNSALALLPDYQNVASAVQTVVGDLVSKSSLASKNNLGGVAYSLLQQESSAANALANVITGKLQGTAAGGRPIASSSVIIPLTNAINSGLKAYEPLKDQKSSGGSGGSSGSSSTDESSSSTETTTSTETTEPASTSSVPPTFTGNSAAGLKVGSGAAALVGALAYIL